jgi:hypothetical protein
MKKALCVAAICALVVAIFGASVYAADIIVKGKVEAAAKDASGKATSVVIVTESAKYTVANDEKGKELLAAVGKTTEATGTESALPDGSKILKVKTFKMVE